MNDQFYIYIIVEVFFIIQIILVLLSAIVERTKLLFVMNLLLGLSFGMRFLQFFHSYNVGFNTPLGIIIATIILFLIWAMAHIEKFKSSIKKLSVVILIVFILDFLYMLFAYTTLNEFQNDLRYQLKHHYENIYIEMQIDTIKYSFGVSEAEKFVENTESDTVDIFTIRKTYYFQPYFGFYEDHYWQYFIFNKFATKYYIHQKDLKKWKVYR